MLTDAQRAAMTARLRKGRDATSTRIPRRPDGLAEIPQTYGQEQLWFIDRFAPGLPMYNIMFGLRASGPLDAGAMSRSVDDLIIRHEALRTRLAATASGRPVQVIDSPRTGTLELMDLSGHEPDERDAIMREFFDTQARRPFSLSAGPLLLTWLLRLSDTDHLLLILVHHSVFDGWSTGVLCRELLALYDAHAASHQSCPRPRCSSPTTRCGNGTGCRAPRSTSSRRTGARPWTGSRPCRCRPTGRAPSWTASRAP